MNEQLIANADGVRTYVVDFPAVGTTTGPAILCLHGLTRNHKDFADLFLPLTQLGRRVIALDIRGRGKSDRDPNPGNYNPLIYCQDVMNVLQKLSIPKAVFLGTSMGGIITMLLASFAPTMIAGAILNDIGPEVDVEGLKRIQGYVGKIGKAATWEEAAQMIGAIGEAAFPGRDGAFWLDFAKRTCVETPEGIVFDYDPAIAQVAQAGGTQAVPTMWDQFAALGPIPTAVIRGGKSDLLSAAIVDKMKLAKPDLITAEVPNVGHAPMLDEPEAWQAITTLVGLTRV